VIIEHEGNVWPVVKRTLHRAILFYKKNSFASGDGIIVGNRKFENFHHHNTFARVPTMTKSKKRSILNYGALNRLGIQ